MDYNILRPSVEATGSVPSLVESFLDAKMAKGLAPKTIHTYHERLKLFTAWLGDRPVTRDTLRFYLAHLQRQTRLSKATIAAYFRDVAVFCGWLVEEKIWDANPAYKLGPKLGKRRPSNYSETQIDGLLDVCDLRDRAIVVVLLDTGIRADVRRLCHSFRVTFAKSFIQEGGDLESLRELLGHEDLSMAAYYAQLADSELAERKRQVNPLGRMIAGARTPDSA